ncbi:MAG: hypothetical protein HYR84_06135 [Planctomycetes bacterium]|nr:hypothetical protein [Planctomycetota bacterium]
MSHGLRRPVQRGKLNPVGSFLHYFGTAPMWDNSKRQRFQQLRQREGSLTDSETGELAALAQELEAAESAYLSGATERTRHERETTEKQNRALEKLAKRKKALVDRLANTLADARIERSAIEDELASVLADGRDSDTQE